MESINDMIPDAEFLKTLTVIYVEDDEDTRVQLSLFLQNRVGVLVTASDGLAGVEAFCAHEADMVVTDIMMPGMDGLTMAEELRRLDPELPIIVTTAFERTDYMSRAIDIGVDRYVTKPINGEKLHAAMMQLGRNLQVVQLAKRLSMRLQQTQKLDVLGAMAGGMAHDFNNLLQISLGNMEFALSCAVPSSDLYSHLQRALVGIKRGTQLGKILLDIAEGHCHFESRGSLRSLVCDSVGATLDGTGIALECTLPDTLPAVTYNAEQMNMVFAQLAGNARNAMPCGGTIRVSGERCVLSGKNALALPEDDYVHVTFSDTGGGILPQHISKIFDPYWSTQPMGPQRGLGLGLTLCYSIIKRHNGLIFAESDPGCGATFHLYLPVAV